MPAYHLRRKEMEMSSEDEMLEVIRSQSHMALAMCKDDRPYLVSLNYCYEPKRRCFYFHCAREGKKIDFLHANPFVWGQIIDDIGYVKGECEYAYRTVMFEGRTEFVDDISEKRAAIELLIDSYESDPEKAKKELVTEAALKKVCIGKVQILAMTGKRSLPKKK